MEEVIGIVLAGGRGERARPLTVKAPGYLRSKAAMSICGRRVIQWLIALMRGQGIEDFFVIAQGKENRYQSKMLVGHGERFGARIRYSRTRFDPADTGSADATLRNLEHWDITRPALVFPSDSLFDFSLSEMRRSHESSGAVATIAAMTRSPAEVANKYGAMVSDSEGHITDFLEKPSLEELREAFPTGSDEGFDALEIPTNAGMYLIDTPQIRKIGQDHEVERMREKQLDFGMDFLPWLVRAHYPVSIHPIKRVGDLGNISDYLDTALQVLEGSYRPVAALMGEPYDRERMIWIEQDTLTMRDEISGKTLEEKMHEGLVEIVGNVRLGRYVVVGPGVRLQACNVDDGIDIGEGTSIRRSAIRDGAILGAYASISDCYVGSMAEVRSDAERRTVLEDHVALGDEVVIQEGAELGGNISVWPGLKIPRAARIPRQTEVQSAEDVLRYL